MDQGDVQLRIRHPDGEGAVLHGPDGPGAEEGDRGLVRVEDVIVEGGQGIPHPVPRIPAYQPLSVRAPPKRPVLLHQAAVGMEVPAAPAGSSGRQWLAIGSEARMAADHRVRDEEGVSRAEVHGLNIGGELPRERSAAAKGAARGNT